MESFSIVFMGNFSYPQGMAATKRIRHLAEHLAARHIRVKVMVLRKNDSKGSGVETRGVCNDVYYESIGNNLVITKNIIKVFHNLIRHFVKGSLFLYRWKYKRSKNILYCYNGINIENILFILIAKLLGYFIIVDIVEDHILTQEKLHSLAKIKLYSVRILEKHLQRCAHAIVVISHYLQKKCEQQVQNRIPVKLIPISAICCDNDSTRKPGNPFKIVYTGSFAKKDGVDLLLAAFDKLRQTHHNCNLLLAGAGVNVAQILKTIEGKGGITYLGYLDDCEFYQLLKDADILCATRTGSKYANAGFPFKLGEYLATGNPVIISDVSDVSCYLRHMKDAIVIEPGSVDAIHNALEFCIKHPDEVKAIGENGRLKCKEHFNPKTNGQCLMELINALH